MVWSKLISGAYARLDCATVLQHLVSIHKGTSVCQQRCIAVAKLITKDNSPWQSGHVLF